MARFSVGRSRALEVPLQRVTVNGRVEPRLLCTEIGTGYGLSGTSARFLWQGKAAGANDAALEDAEVVVSAGARGRPRSTVFRGWIERITHREDAGGTGIGAEARSVLFYLDRFRVGELRATRGLQLYRQEDGWTLATILEDWFRSGVMSPNLRTALKLGSTEAVRVASAEVVFPDLTFPATSLRDGLRRLLGLVPDVGVYETFDSVGTTLEFYRVGDPGGLRTVRAATATQDVEAGVAVVGHVRRSDTQGVFSFVQGWGRPVREMVTIGTDHGTAPLVPAWPNASSYEGLHGESESTPTADEAAVLADPELATPGSPRYDPDLGATFRLFRIPESMRRYQIESANVARDGNVVRIPTQLHAEKYAYTDGVGTKTGAISTTDWEMVRGAALDEDGVIELPRPLLGLASVSADGEGGEVRVWSRVHLYLTATLTQLDGPRLNYRTRTVGSLGLPLLADDGLGFYLIHEGLGLDTVGTGPSGLTGTDGVDHVFGARWYRESTGEWLEIEEGSISIVSDDGAELAELCERAFAERQARRTEASVELPSCVFGWRLGDGLRLLNRGIDARTLQVTSVGWDLVTGRTAIEATDQVPFLVSGARVAGGYRGVQGARAAGQREEGLGFNVGAFAGSVARQIGGLQNLPALFGSGAGAVGAVARIAARDAGFRGGG